MASAAAIRDAGSGNSPVSVRTMLVFLDTEFTDFARPDLISLALVSEDGREFYAERTDYFETRRSDFVRETIQPLLGRVPGAACTHTVLTN